MLRIWLPALAVAATVAALALPRALSRWWLSPDVIEYLAIAHVWVNGAGFVNPVQWNFFLDSGVPLPAFAVRAPAISVLAAIPFALGASVTTVSVLHALFASGVAGASVLVVRSFAGVGAAVAAGIWLGLSPAWLRAAPYVMTEVPAVAGVLLVLASARGVLRSVPAALLCSAATVLAWTARPTLIALALAIVVAASSVLGLRQTLRHLPLFAYAAGVAVGTACIVGWVDAATGLAPYEGYGVARELFGADDGFRFQKEYVGAWRFVELHGEEVWRRVTAFGWQLVTALFLSSRFHFAGWLLLPGLVHAFWRRGPGALEQRIAALSGLGFALITVSYFAAFDRWRYPLPTAVCAILCGVPAIEASARRLARGVPGSFARLLPGASVALAVAGVLSVSSPTTVASSASHWASFREQGTRDGSGFRVPRNLHALCSRLERDAIVASIEPWNVTFRCGQASIRLAVDLTTSEWQERFLDEKHVTHLLADRSPVTQWLSGSDRLRRVAAAGPYILYEVIHPTRPEHPWRAPRPTACAGRTECPGMPGRESAT